MCGNKQSNKQTWCTTINNDDIMFLSSELFYHKNWKYSMFLIAAHKIENGTYS